MDWIVSLFTESSIAHDVVVYSLVIALGVLLGKIKFFGISLGVTFVLFVGIVMSHFGFSIANATLLNFIRDFGLILFVFSIGMQVGPGFFSSFKKGGVQMNMLAVMVVLLNVVVALVIYYTCDVKIAQIVGILSGAVTNTPGLGAAQQALGTLDPATAGTAEDLSMGYAAAYPLGVVGIILSMILLKAVFRVKIEKEQKEIEDENEDSTLKPYVVTFQVENHRIDGKTIGELHMVIDHDFVVSRMKVKETGEVIIPTSKTVVSKGDLLLTVCSIQDESAFQMVIGPVVDMEWEAESQSNVVSRRILVTKSHYNGRTLGSLRLHNGYNLNATRVNRAGLDLQLETAGGRPHHRGGRPEPHRASCHTPWQLDETPARTEYGDNVYRHIHRYHCRFNSFRHPGNVGVDEARSCRRSAGGGYPVEPFRI